jgi:RpiR family transcriptional regulator, carbohydrate utilization regulator
MAMEAPGEEAVIAAALVGRSTRGYLRARMQFLVKSEARVAEALIEHDGDLQQLSVAELAEEASTSTATVVRAAQSLGFTGFSELRDQLVHEVDSVDDRNVTVAENLTLAALDLTLQAGIDQINSMSAMLNRESFEQAVDALATARRVLFVTMSDLAFLGQYAVLHFAMVGRSAEAPPDVVTAHAVASLLEPGDVMVAIGYSGTNALTLRIAETAAGAGATVIAITSFARGALTEIADIHLAVGVPGADQVADALRRIRVGQMLIIDALQAALSTRLDTRRPAEAMLRTLTQYGYRRPRSSSEE